MQSTKADLKSYNAPISQLVKLNYIAADCAKPYTNNGDFSKNVTPIESAQVTMLDGEALSPSPRLDVEGFCRVLHKVDLTDLAHSKDATARYRDSLIPFAKDVLGADEICMFPYCVVRTQIEGITKERKFPANFAHADMTDSGAWEMERYLYPPRQRPKLKRLVHLNMWRLLSESPTDLPLALCDVRSVEPGDLVEGSAYFPTVGAEIGTGFYHPNDHFRWVYFSKLIPDEMLIFKQFDSDSSFPSRVPHVAFTDPSCPPGAAPRISIEARCIGRWYE